MRPTRRQMLQTSAAIALSGSLTLPIACATGRAERALPAAVRRRDETILRLGGLGDGYKMTWAADGRQYFVVNDGSGWLSPPDKFSNSRLWNVAGKPPHGRFEPVAGYPDLDKMARPDDAPSYYGHGSLAAGGKLFQFLSTLDRRTATPRRWTGAKLIQSPDGGTTWQNMDGSTPVIWEDWREQPHSLTFFDEAQGAFSLISILQMGCDYALNRDGFVYFYSPNGSIDGQMNELVMARVPTDRIADRSAYRFYAGSDGAAAWWSADMAARAPVHRFPAGWVNSTNLFDGDLVVEAWLPSVTYVEALGIYLMAASGTGCAADGTAFGKPSYLGLWASREPWGPWQQIYEDKAWTPGGDAGARAYAPQIVPGWIADNGKSFWLAWSDLQGLHDFVSDRALLGAELGRAADRAGRTAVIAEFHRRKLPHYALNVQLVDLLF